MKKLLLALALVLSVGLSVFAFFPAATVKRASAEEPTETSQTFVLEMCFYRSVDSGKYMWLSEFVEVELGIEKQYTRVPDNFRQGDHYYEFKGWRCLETGKLMSAPLTLLYDTVPNDKAFSAEYDIADLLYRTVTFVTPAGLVKRDVTYGGHIPDVDPGTPEGYTFAGWYTDPEHTAYYDAETAVVKSDFTLYPLFVPDKNNNTDGSKTEIEETIEKGFSAIGLTGLTFTAQIAIIVAGVLILIQIFK